MNSIQEYGEKKTLKVRDRLFLGFGMILLTLAVAIGIAIYKITIAENSANEVIETELPTFNAYLNLNGQLYQSKAALESWLLTRDPQDKEDFMKALGNINREQSILDEDSKSWSSDYRAKWGTTVSLLDQM